MSKLLISTVLLCTVCTAMAVKLPSSSYEPATTNTPRVVFEYDAAGNRTLRHIENSYEELEFHIDTFKINRLYGAGDNTAEDNSQFSLQAEAFPNPTTGPLTVSISGQAASDVAIAVYTSVGSLLLTSGASIGDNAIDLSVYPQGQYIVTVTSGTETIESFKIIKN